MTSDTRQAGRAPGGPKRSQFTGALRTQAENAPPRAKGWEGAKATLGTVAQTQVPAVGFWSWMGKHQKKSKGTGRPS